MTERLALFKVMLALSKTERPAVSVNAPEPVEEMADETVMSLLACILTAVPALSRLTMSLART